MCWYKEKTQLLSSHRYYLYLYENTEQEKKLNHCFYSYERENTVLFSGIIMSLELIFNIIACFFVYKTDSEL